MEDNNIIEDIIIATETMPPLGEDYVVEIPELNVRLRKGTSLQIIAKASQVIQADTFQPTDINNDWKEQQDRGASLFYGLLEQIDNDEPVCALRAIMEPASATAFSVHPPRLIIDYVQTPKSFQGRGYATRLCRSIINMAEILGANVYVLALEETAIWWTQRCLGVDGFVLEEDANLNRQLNTFNDTFLFRAAFNKKEYVVNGEEEDEDMDDDDDDNNNNDNNNNDDDDDDDLILQQVLAASLIEK